MSQVYGLVPKDLPLKFAKDLQLLLNLLRRITAENNSVIEEIETDKAIYTVKDKDPQSNFYFRLLKLVHDNPQNPKFSVEYCPSNDISLDKAALALFHDSVVQQYNLWINRIRGYESITFSKEDEFIKKYENEFFNYFDILDDDADTAPLDVKQQYVAHNFLERIEQILLEQPGENYTEIIEQTQELKSGMSSLTKRSFIKKVSTILSKIWAKKASMGKLILDTASKEVIKRGIDYTINNADDLFNLLSRFFAS